MGSARAPRLIPGGYHACFTGKKLCLPTLLTPDFLPFFVCLFSFCLWHVKHTLESKFPKASVSRKELGLGDEGSTGQRQGGFRGLTGKFCSRHRWKVPLGRGQGFETCLANGT